jgi:hypothetical protein
MRVSVQLRAPRPDSNDLDRWQRSVFVDASDVTRTVDFADFRPVGADQAPPPGLASVRSIMFVVDPVNTRRGTSSRFWVKHAILYR